MKELYILGAGGHGVVVAEIAVALGYCIRGFIDDDAQLHGTRVLSWEVLGGRQRVPSGADVALAVGDNRIRAELLSYAKSSGWNLPVLIHPSAVISSSAKLGLGTAAMALAVANARSIVGDACILNTACSVDHDCVLGSCVHIAPGARLGGGVTVGDGALLGIGSCVRPYITIGSWTLMGAGSVVVASIPNDAVAYGNPAAVRSWRNGRHVDTHATEEVDQQDGE